MGLRNYLELGWTRFAPCMGPGSPEAWKIWELAFGTIFRGLGLFVSYALRVPISGFCLSDVSSFCNVEQLDERAKSSSRACYKCCMEYGTRQVTSSLELSHLGSLFTAYCIAQNSWARGAPKETHDLDSPSTLLCTHPPRAAISNG